MSGQPTVLQVVIMRDGLLVGTEVFVPGQYTLGSDDGADLRLDDATVQPSHAILHFQNGRAAIQDNGSGTTFVNGHKVTACEVKPADEIACGPFTLKVRVMNRKSSTQQAPSPEVAALLAPQASAPARAAPPSRPVTTPARPPPPATVVSNRRLSTAAQQLPDARPAPARPHLRPVPREEPTPRPEALDATSTDVPVVKRVQPPPPPPVSSPRPATPHKAASPAPAHRKSHFSPVIPPPPEGGKGKPHLFVELYWGDTRRHAQSYRKIDKKKKLIAREDDRAPVPLYGFPLEGADFVFAEQQADLYRVYVPPGATVERRAQDGKFYAVQVETLEQSPDARRCVTLGTGHAIRFLADHDVLLLAYVQPPIPKPFVNPLKGLPWLAMAVLTLFLGGFGAFVARFSDLQLDADFQTKRVNPVAVKLIAPPKPEEKKKLEKQVEKMKKEEKKPEVAKKIEKELPKQVAPDTKKALKSIEKLAAAGPAMKDLLAAVDKLGAGPGSKTAKNDFKLSGLIGKAPIANAGLGTFGLGGGGAGGSGMQGAELLRGKGGGGIGALGAGRVGKGAVAGTVTRASTRSVGAQGSIDKEAVAKVINSHLAEVSSCYERALLKTPGLAGKIVLEWQITTSGGVGYAKTKTSTMQSAAVESCILASLKTWRFPPAKGSGVVITYPFMFNSVGY